MKHINYLAQNAKMRKTSGLKTFNFGIPALKSNTGMITCPMAGECAKGCYATQGAYVWGNVNKKYEERLQLTRTNKFIYTITAEILRRKVERVRIHDSGDFYSAKYLDRWLTIMELNPEIEFYAYTKMVKLFNMYKRDNKIPSNFTVIYSYGGKHDVLINPELDRHGRVFENEEYLLNKGYIDASQDDSLALTENVKVGLIFHSNKKWDNTGWKNVK